MQNPSLNVYLALVGFAIFMMAMFFCLPKIDQFIKYLEDKGQDGRDPAPH